MSAVGCTVETSLPPSLPALIESVAFGTAGLRYRRTDAAAQLDRLHDPVFVAARDGAALLGGYALDRRALLVGARPVAGVYRGALCVAPGAQGRGVGRALAARGRAWIDELARTAGAPVLSWGCIDEGNHRSLAVLRREGAEPIAGLAMFMLYRQAPRERVALETLPPGRDPRERVALAAALDDCAVRDVTPSALPGLALVDGHGIRVGARVAPSGYRIETMGRALDALVRVGVTPFPPARRRFDPDAFRYVRLADVTLREGCERDWKPFVSAVLARHGAHFGMAFVDPTSRLHARLRRIGPLGPLVHSGDAALRVMARWSPPGADATAPGLPAGPLALAPVDG